MIERIKAELAAIERSEEVRVLFAAESGSRAWGFESPDSDWDVRFVYVHPRDWYLSIESRRDVIERMLPDDIDLAGWDLPKALGLFSKSNPALLEWLRSPIVYAEDPEFVRQLRKFERDYVRPSAGLYHYRSMTLSNYKNLVGQPEVPLKKYLYCLRPALACRFIRRTRKWPPMEFRKLVSTEVSDPKALEAIDGLLEAKMRGGEMGRGPRIPVLDAIIEDTLNRVHSVATRRPEKSGVEPLNQLFRAYTV
ncbi:MAG TPA: nucleotidyltransferase domain-containing protein [Fimbriimonadaceae bacterium]|nr:nucleotidyltransferase domain-containing protein [Fimbriimonadaceae bacterium]